MILTDREEMELLVRFPRRRGGDPKLVEEVTDADMFSPQVRG